MGCKPKNIDFTQMAGFALDENNKVILLNIPFQNRTEAGRDFNEKMLRALDVAFNEGPGPEEKPN